MLSAVAHDTGWGKHRHRHPHLLGRKRRSGADWNPLTSTLQEGDANPEVLTDPCPLSPEGTLLGQVHVMPPCPQMSLTAFGEVPSTHGADWEPSLFLALLTAPKSSLKRNLLIILFPFFLNCGLSSLLFHALAKDENYFWVSICICRAYYFLFL